MAMLIRDPNTLSFERNGRRAVGGTAVPMMLATPSAVMNSRHAAPLRVG
jgi:hypothetical protein